MVKDSIYARFVDIFDSPEEPRAVFQSDGKIEFVQSNGEPAPVQESSDKSGLTPSLKMSTSIRRKMIAFVTLCILVLCLLVLSIVNLSLLVKSQSEISKNTQRINEKLGHPVLENHVNGAVDQALTSWGNGVLVRLQNVSVQEEDLQKQLNQLMWNLSSDLIRRLRVELGVTSRLIEERTKNYLLNLTSEVREQLKKELEIDPAHLDMAVHRAMSNLTERSLALIRGICETAHAGKCYWAVRAGSIPYKNAEALCEQRGAMAANIYDEEHYKAMMKYLRNSMLPLDTIWLGMTINIQTRKLYLVNGTESSYSVQWTPKYPSSDATATQLGLKFTQNDMDSNQGFFNYPIINRTMGILCEL